MNENININKTIQLKHESTLRKKYRLLTESYYINYSLYTKKKDELENKYSLIVKKNKKKFNIIRSILLFLILITIIIIIYKQNPLQKIIVLGIVLGIDFLLVFFLIKLKKKEKKILKIKQLELNYLYNQILLDAEKKLDEAAKLVIDLMIEEEHAKTLFNLRKTSDENTYKAALSKLKKIYAEKIKNVLMTNKNEKISSRSITSFYDNWYNDKHFKEIDREQRLKLAEFKSTKQ